MHKPSNSNKLEQRHPIGNIPKQGQSREVENCDLSPEQNQIMIKNHLQKVAEQDSLIEDKKAQFFRGFDQFSVEKDQILNSQAQKVEVLPIPENVQVRPIERMV